MGTNRYHFSFIPKEHHIKSVSTSFQYFIKHEDIVKHVRFKQLRAEKGSIFAFHGSPQENWHAILRSGLQIGKGGYLVSRKTKFENKNKSKLETMVICTKLYLIEKKKLKYPNN